jgi:hypothetical protein
MPPAQPALQIPPSEFGPIRKNINSEDCRCSLDIGQQPTTVGPDFAQAKSIEFFALEKNLAHVFLSFA